MLVLHEAVLEHDERGRLIDRNVRVVIDVVFVDGVVIDVVVFVVDAVVIVIEIVLVVIDVVSNRRNGGLLDCDVEADVTHSDCGVICVLGVVVNTIVVVVDGVVISVVVVDTIVVVVGVVNAVIVVGIVIDAIVVVVDGVVIDVVILVEFILVRNIIDVVYDVYVRVFDRYCPRFAIREFLVTGVSVVLVERRGRSTAIAPSSRPSLAQ
ncbi:hypothetical protein D8S78_11255 [Natrialba swarupiae]|nr:hypothetical protein [Natrialba swarupiae]